MGLVVSAFLASVIVLAVIVGVLRLILVEIDLASDPESPDTAAADRLDGYETAVYERWAGDHVGHEQEPATAPAWGERGAVAVAQHRVDARIRLVILVAGAGTLVAALVSAMVAVIARVAQ